jgi:TPR repeat protein
MPSSVYSNFFLLLRFDKRVSREWNIDSALMRQPEELVNSALENAAEGADSLPKSDLNPLINPVLGRNLGRWAQVYFTSPPEKREEAVGELLRELESETPGGQPTTARPETLRNVQSQPHVAIPHQLLCPVCQRLNQIGQRFCGYCAQPLTPEAARDSRHNTEESNQADASAMLATGEDELQWLRDKSLSSFEPSQAPARRGFRYLVIGVFILVATFGYLQWASQSRAGSSAQPSVVSSPSTSLQPLAQAKDASPLKPLEDRQPAAVSSNAPDTSVSRKSSEPGPRPEPSRQAIIPEPARDKTDGAGADELVAAQRYLEGKNGARDSSQAAKWLWKAVGKQNPGAALMLAELYARGDGVPKSCDQARLLLVAAAKKGTPNADLRLRDLESNGCQ